MDKIVVLIFSMISQFVVCQRPCNLFCDENESPSAPWSGRGSVKGDVGSPGKKGPMGRPGQKGGKGDVCDVDCPTLGRLMSTVPRLQSILDSMDNVPRSCFDIKNNNNAARNGVYNIRDSNNIKYPVYCDMSINNGGWTLVASIHENNIRRSSGKCTIGDKWSSEYGNHRGTQTGGNAWFDYQIFGKVVSATSEDYKAPAYFDVTARDVMIWQVPNDTPLQAYNSASYLQYRTSNGFLSQYDGNLFNLYKTHFPLKSGVYTKVTGNGPAIPVTFDKGNGDMVRKLFGDNVKPHIDTGFIEFRAINNERSAYAMCPGTKAKRSHVNLEHSCIGSTADNDHVNYCGDFAGYVWDNYGTGGTGWNADLKLIQSTYLVFYR